MRSKHFTILEKSPESRIREQSGRSKGTAAQEKPFVEQGLTSFGQTRNLETIPKDNAEQLLALALKTIEDPNFLKETLTAIKEKESKTAGDKPGLRFAQIENTLVMLLLNLSEGDKKAIIDKYLRRFKDYFNKHAREYQLDTVVQSKYLSTLEGTAAVVNFIRDRTYQRQAELKARDLSQDFLFNRRLDAENKIDLIEIIYRSEPGAGVPEMEIEEMNLVQIKSRVQNEEEINSILVAHTDWTNERFLDIQELIGYYADGLKNITLKREVVADLIIKTAADLERGQKTNEAEMIKELIGLLPSGVVPIKRQKIGFFYTHFTDLISEAKAIEKDYSDSLEVVEVVSRLIEIAEKYRRMMPQVTSPKQVNSIIASGQKILSRVVLSDKPTKAMKYG